MSKQSIKFNLRDMFPNATEEQFIALEKKLPVPPSPEWIMANGFPSKGQAGFSPPATVSCVLVAGEPKRVRLIRRAIRDFLEQTYTHKQLVIVNATGIGLDAILGDTMPAEQRALLKEVPLTTPMTLGAMRNVGISQADGTWIKQWDDDDIYHPFLLAYQMATRREGTGNLLTTQIRASTVNGNAYLHTQWDGIANTLLAPRIKANYPLVDSGEDVAFLLANWAVDVNIVNNATYPANCLNIAVFHGHNVLPVEKFMVDNHDAQWRGVWKLLPPEQKHLRQQLAAVGFVIKTAEEMRAEAELEVVEKARLEELRQKDERIAALEREVFELKESYMSPPAK